MKIINLEKSQLHPNLHPTITGTNWAREKNTQIPLPDRNSSYGIGTGYIRNISQVALPLRSHGRTLDLTPHGSRGNVTFYVGIRFIPSVVHSFRHSSHHTNLQIIVCQGLSLHQKTTEAKKRRRNGWKGVSLQWKQTIFR